IHSHRPRGSRRIRGPQNLYERTKAGSRETPDHTRETSPAVSPVSAASFYDRLTIVAEISLWESYPIGGPRIMKFAKCPFRAPPDRSFRPSNGRPKCSRRRASLEQ